MFSFGRKEEPKDPKGEHQGESVYGMYQFWFYPAGILMCLLIVFSFQTNYEKTVGICEKVNVNSTVSDPDFNGRSDK